MKRGCPACVVDDIARNRGLAPFLAVHFRSWWHVDAIKTCPAHERPLVEIANDLEPRSLHDFARHLRTALARIPPLTDETVRQVPSALETYVLDRLEGRRDRTFLDELELYAAIKACEAFGAVSAFGRAVIFKHLDEPAWRLAGGAGFEILAGGASTIYAFLDGLMATAAVMGRGAKGPQAIYGRSLYDWLSRGSPDQAFAPVRNVVRAHITNNLPLAAGTIVLSKPLAERRLHSIRTATLESGSHPKRLRRLLKAAGIVPEQQDCLPDTNGPRR